MVFYIIGLGLGDHRDITIKGLDVCAITKVGCENL
jgi:diphthamide biosynthesis methyltransferase